LLVLCYDKPLILSLLAYSSTIQYGGFMHKKHLSGFSLLVLFVCLVFSCKKETASSNEDRATSLSNTAASKSKSITASKSVFATGLNNPRGLKFGPDGNLYVAEAGVGGTISSAGFGCEQAPPPFGPYFGNATGGRVSMIDMNGNRTTVTTQLPSATSSIDDILGPADVAFIGNTLYILETGGGCSRGLPNNPSGVYRVNSNGTTSLVADLSAWQHANPVANPEEEDFEPDGSWYSMTAIGNELYALEANHGELDKIQLDGTVSRVVDISASQGHIVPTAMDYRGNFYVGNLQTFPIMGNSKIFKINPAGNMHVVAENLSTVLGLVITKTSWMYVLEMTTGAAFPTPGAGRILAISPSGERSVLTSGLNFPTGMTMGPDGNLYVSSWGFGMPPGGGQVVKVTLQ
jgi:sugar lactone lactonase YvrE